MSYLPFFFFLLNSAIMTTLHVLKPVNVEEVENLVFPLYGTPKIDGFRAYQHEGVLHTASGLRVANAFLQRLCIPEGWDMELFCEDFRTTSSIVTSTNLKPLGLKIYLFDQMPTPATVDGYIPQYMAQVPGFRKPREDRWGAPGTLEGASPVFTHQDSRLDKSNILGMFKEFFAIRPFSSVSAPAPTKCEIVEPVVKNRIDHIFSGGCFREIDYTTGYLDRLRWLEERYPVNLGMTLHAPTFGSSYLNVKVVYLRPVRVSNQEQMNAYVDKCIAEGYEGAMFRRPDSIYRFGRSDGKSAELIRVKPLEDGEAVIVGFEELYHNTNAPTINVLGFQERSTHKSGLVPGDTLGAFVCRIHCDQCNNTGLYAGEKCLACESTFNIGSGKGLTQSLRKEIWSNKDAYLGKIVKFRHLDHGNYDKPRTGIYLGFRAPEDMTSY